ncbi:acyl-CoA-binding protein 2 [Nadsonia fulvescens var. elongata DSM 6958]|uniref:Acyl-CoA-binding protein 2 n=1 Tax=Nadsonia fulvescens var. elongata DSM 6958 TaxID=857566 RepID=A0A1E3PF70_9ASCO|nr:acyl-CoA-binding protein 2 [Nadsonia fulvescens var. elongata DSM 6958]
MVSATFEQKAEAVKTLTSKPSDETLLKLYGLYKQATVGDNNTSKPGVFDLKGKYKWQAWEDLKGKSQEDAEKEYIELVDSLLA